MPINLHSFLTPKKSRKEDLDFLAAQGLSESQINSINKYWRRKLLIESTLVSVAMSILFFFGNLAFLALPVLWSLMQEK